jgi:ABC-type antimicrobial peptide transport system permease subunit
VIGVVGDVKQWGLTHAPVPEAYTALDGDSRVFVVVHTSLPPDSLVPQIRQAVAQIDPDLPLFSIRTMDQVIADQAVGQQFLAALVGMFSSLALLLAAVGIYGVLSYLVTQRTREIGIRMSLGATRGRVLGLVLVQGLRLAGIGLGIGLLAAPIASRLLAGTLHQVKWHDPMILVVTPLCLAFVAYVACYLPARRATKVDPVVALRYE